MKCNNQLLLYTETHLQFSRNSVSLELVRIKHLHQNQIMCIASTGLMIVYLPNCISPIAQPFNLDFRIILVSINDLCGLHGGLRRRHF
jgi:hypothetical protein